jgi:hypothetical protein
VSPFSQSYSFLCRLCLVGRGAASVPKAAITYSRAPYPPAMQRMRRPTCSEKRFKHLRRPTWLRLPCIVDGLQPREVATLRHSALPTSSSIPSSSLSLSTPWLPTSRARGVSHPLRPTRRTKARSMKTPLVQSLFLEASKFLTIRILCFQPVLHQAHRFPAFVTTT